MKKITSFLSFIAENITNVFRLFICKEVILAIIGVVHCFVLWEGLRFSIQTQGNVNILVIACFFSTILAVIFGFFGLCAIMKVIAFEKSTHQIEYVPVSPDDVNRDDKMNWKKLEKEMMKGADEMEKDGLSNRS